LFLVVCAVHGDARCCSATKHCTTFPLGNFNNTGAIDEKTDWVPVNIKLGAEPNTIEVDLSKSACAAFGLRYDWQSGGVCCAEMQAEGRFFCEPGSCPRKLKKARLPANPSMAKIIGGKCKCMPPQVCDELI
jgi:hypothetical protein